MKWGMNIFGRRHPKGQARVKRGVGQEQQNVKMPKKLRRSVDERLREAEFRDMYRTRDNLSTKALKSKIVRLEAEQKFKQLVEAPEKARLEALHKKKQARLAFAGRVISAGLDVYSKLPSELAGKGKTGDAAVEAIKKFKMSQAKVGAFKDVPITMTKFTQSGVNMGETINGVYIPSQNDLLLHYGKKGMKWKKKKAMTPEEEIEQNDAAYHSAKKEIDRLETMLSKYKKGKGKISSVKSVQDQIDKFKESVRTYQDKDDEIRSRTGSKYQSKSPMYSETVDKKTGAKFRKYNRNFKHSGISEDTLLHYGKKGMKWRKKGEGAIPGMSPAEMAIAEARAKQDSKSYNYNLKMREEAIKNAIKRGASGKENRRLQGLQKDDQRKVDMNNKHKAALKKGDRNRSSYSRTVEEVDASNGNKPKFKKYKY
nr:MAG TPA: hypothetical protein [Caudoviricetes sp.]